MSIFDKMKKEVRLAKNFKTAKDSVPNQRIENKAFPGEDGEYVVQVSAFQDFAAKDVNYTEFQFTLANVESQEDVVGKKLNIFTKWEEDEWNTLESIQETFMQNCQLIGVPTSECTDVMEVKAGIEAAVRERRKVKVAVVTNKKGYKNVYIRGVWDGEEEDAEYVEEEVVQDSDEAEADEWEVETAEEVETTEEVEEEEPSYLPSEWVGYPCTYDGESYMVSGADDGAMTVDIEDADGNEYGPIPYDEVTFE